MKKTIFFLCIVLTSFALESKEALPIKSSKVSLGTDCFFLKNPDKHHYDPFLGLKLGYDFEKPEFFYFGLDGLLTVGLENHSWLAITKAEQRFGFTFYPCENDIQSTVTPYIGIGCLNFHNIFLDSTLTYLTNGFRFHHTFCSHFQGNLHLKLFYIFSWVQ